MRPDVPDSNLAVDRVPKRPKSYVTRQAQVAAAISVNFPDNPIQYPSCSCHELKLIVLLMPETVD